METKKIENYDVITDPIRGSYDKDKKLYMIFWERFAGSGTFLCWARDEEDAVNAWGFSPNFVKHTVVEINPLRMPVVIGGKN